MFSVLLLFKWVGKAFIYFYLSTYFNILNIFHFHLYGYSILIFVSLIVFCKLSYSFLLSCVLHMSLSL